MLGSAGKNLARLRRITAVLGKYGYAELVRRAVNDGDELAVAADAAETAVSDGLSGPRRFRSMLEELGPTFIKFGQVLSTRPDLVSSAYVAELRTLQDHCEAIDYEAIKEAIRTGLGRAPDELFASIDPVPVATASIAQVHRGTTKDGADVAIKVQRPGIAQEVRRDIDLLYQLAQLFDAVVEESAMTEPVGVVSELDRALTDELNFLHEAANCREFGHLHENRPDMVIPVVFDDLSSTTVLTMSYVEGVPFSRLPEGVDHRAIAERMVREAFDQVFVDGVYHADPHPGNLLYLPDGRYAILDFGLIGKLTPQMQETLVVLALAVSVRDADTVARTIYRLGQGNERVNLSAVRDDATQMLNRYLDRSISDIDSTLLMQDVLTLGMKHQLRIPSEYTMLGRAGSTLEGIVRELDPHIDVAEVARPYAERLLLNRVGLEQVEGNLYRALLQFQGLSNDIPLQVSQILADLSSGKTQVRVLGPQLDRLHASVLMAGTIVAGSILGGAFIIGAFIALARIESTLFGVPAVGLLGAFFGVGIALWVGAYALFRPRLRKLSLLRLFVGAGQPRRR